MPALENVSIGECLSADTKISEQANSSHESLNEVNRNDSENQVKSYFSLFKKTIYFIAIHSLFLDIDEYIFIQDDDYENWGGLGVPKSNTRSKRTFRAQNSILNPQVYEEGHAFTLRNIYTCIYKILF